MVSLASSTLLFVCLLAHLSWVGTSLDISAQHTQSIFDASSGSTCLIDKTLANLRDIENGGGRVGPFYVGSLPRCAAFCASVSSESMACDATGFGSTDCSQVRECLAFSFCDDELACDLLLNVTGVDPSTVLTTPALQTKPRCTTFATVDGEAYSVI